MHLAGSLGICFLLCQFVAFIFQMQKRMHYVNICSLGTCPATNVCKTGQQTFYQLAYLPMSVYVPQTWAA